MNVYLDKEEKKAHRKKGFIIFGTVLTLGLSSVFGYQYLQHNNVGPLSAKAQSSLIQAETTAVKNNAKPVEVITPLLKNWEKLSEKNQSLAGDLIYTSVQNSAVYYNNAVLLMQGEIAYNRISKTNSLSAVDKSAWVLGFVQDIENNSLKSYNLNKDRILILPDFEELVKSIGKDVSSELREFLTISANVQKYKIFTDKEIDVSEANKAYQQIIDDTAVFAKKYPNSKYLSDLASQARIFHDVIFGYTQTNNVTLGSDGKYSISDSQLKAIEKISKNRGALKEEATAYLKKVKDGKISPEYLQEGSQASLEVYGSNVYWQTDTDLQALIKSDGSVNLNNESEASND